MSRATGRPPGPPPMPRVLQLLHGEQHRDRINPREPVPRAALPEPPFPLQGEAKELWDYHLREVAHMRLVTAADREAFWHMVEAMADHRRIARLCAQSAPAIQGQKKNLVENPLYRMKDRASRLVFMWATQFGLTPSARRTLAQNERDAEDAAAELLS